MPGFLTSPDYWHNVAPLTGRSESTGRKSMDKTYDPQAIETRLYQDWEDHHYFAPAGNGQAYCIMLPPPNVTGSLHMGHAFQHTLMDILIRYQDRKSTRLNSSHIQKSRMPSSA